MVEKRVKDIDSVLRRFVEELNKQIEVDQVVLFGSYGRNDPRDYSDIDVAVVSPDFHGGNEADYLLLGRVARRVHVLLEPIPYTPEDFEKSDLGDFISEIKKSGRIVYKKSPSSLRTPKG